MALIAVDSVRCASSLTDPRVGPERSRDRQVTGELRQQGGMQAPVVGDIAEPDPGVEHRRADRRVGVVGVGRVHDADVAAR